MNQSRKDERDRISDCWVVRRHIHWGTDPEHPVVMTPMINRKSRDIFDPFFLPKISHVNFDAFPVWSDSQPWKLFVNGWWLCAWECGDFSDLLRLNWGQRCSTLGNFTWTSDISWEDVLLYVKLKMPVMIVDDRWGLIVFQADNVQGGSSGTDYLRL